MIDSEQIQKLLELDEQTEDKAIEVMNRREADSVCEIQTEMMDEAGSICPDVRVSVTGLRYWDGETRGVLQEETAITRIWECLSRLHYVEEGTHEDTMGDENEGIWLDFITDKGYISVVLYDDKVCLENTWHTEDADIADTVRNLIAQAESDEG